MNTIHFYLRKINEGKAIIVNEYNREPAAFPSCVRGHEFQFLINIFGAQGDIEPIADFPGITKWNAFVFGEWINEAAPYLQAAQCIENEGTIAVTFDETNTTSLAAAIDGLPAINSWLEIDGYAENSNTPSITIQCKICIENRGQDLPPPTPPVENYYTKTQINILLSQKADRADFDAHITNHKIHLPTEGAQYKKVLSIDKDGNPVWVDNQATGGEQVDWNESDPDSPAYIKNKPTIPTTAGEVGAIPSDEKGAANGVAELNANGKIPDSQLVVIGANRLGVAKTGGVSYGVTTDANGMLMTARADDSDIDNASNSYKPIVPSNVNYAVKSALTGTNHINLNADEKTTAQTILNVSDISAVGRTIALSIDPQTYVMTLLLKNADGGTLSTQSIDLPIESMVISASYLDGILTLTLQSGQTLDVDISSIVNGLINSSEKGAANGVAELDNNGVVPIPQLPMATQTTAGIVKVNTDNNYGILINSQGNPLIDPATNGDIDARTQNYKPIVPSKLNYAVVAALTDQNHIVLTAEQQTAAQNTLGVAPQVQADWNENDTASKSYIQNKPNLAPAPIITSIAPTTSTVGVVGQLYVNTATSKTYHCTAITNTGTEQEPAWSYTWTDDVNAMGGMFASTATIRTGSNNYPVVLGKGITIGLNNSASGSSLVVGGYSSGGSYSGIAVGAHAALQHGGSVCLGTYVRTGDSNQLVSGKYNVTYGGARAVGNGSSDSARLNIEELSWTGDHYIYGGHQQEIHVIPAATTAVTLTEGCHSHTPDAATTYTFPAVTDTTRTHQIRLCIDFTTIQTYAFVDSTDTAIVPLFTPTIAAGDVYEFRCEYSVIKQQWLIWPCKQGAVSDDYVMQAEVGAANGVAGLDANGLVPSSQIPKAGNATRGGVKIHTAGSYGLKYQDVTTDNLVVNTADDSQINGRTDKYHPIAPNKLNYAVTAALTDANHITLNAAQQETARSVLGISQSSQVQADWDEEDSAAGSYIRNKPAIPSPQVYGENTMQFAGDSAIGKAWYYNAVDLTNKQIYLCSQQVRPVIGTGTLDPEVTVDPAAIGKSFIISNGSRWAFQATVTAINGSVVTYSGDIGFTEIDQQETLSGGDEFSIMFEGDYSHGAYQNPGKGVAIGRSTAAPNYGSMANGRETVALGEYGHAEGTKTKAGYAAHSEGISTIANVTGAHAEGSFTKAQGYAAHAEGYATQANGKYTHAEGLYTRTSAAESGWGQTVMGKYNAVRDDAQMVVGCGTSDSQRMNSMVANNNGEVEINKLIPGAISIGRLSGSTIGAGSVVLGPPNQANGKSSATAEAALAHGYLNIASGLWAHAEGQQNTASGQGSHAEGHQNTVSAMFAHAEGYRTEATAAYAHAEGAFTHATAARAHAEGYGTYAEHECAHAEGQGTKTGAIYQHVQGKFNVIDATSLLIIGNGTSDGARSNALKLDENGNLYIAGALDCATYRKTVTDIASTSIVLANAAANTDYHYGTLTSLNISAVTASDLETTFDFVCNSNGCTLSLPASVNADMVDAPEAGKRFLLSIRNGVAVGVNITA